VNRIALASCVAALCAAAASADAAVMVASYSGVFFSGNDQAGIFVTPNGSLAGYRFVASYTYDTALGVRTTVPGVSDKILGGDSTGDATPILSATLSLNGVTYDFSSNYHGYVLVQADFAGHNTVFDTPHLLSQYLTAYSELSGAPTSLEGSGQDLHTVYQSQVDFEIFGRPSLTDPFTRTWGQTKFGSDLTYSVAPLDDDGGGGGGGGHAGGVPEPSAWTLLIAGFGLAGAALRRRAGAPAPRPRSGRSALRSVPPGRSLTLRMTAPHPFRKNP